jgi:subtilisin family serine protease
MEDPEGTGFGLVGVAPEATILMYRVFGCAGYTTDEIILRAMERASNEGADIISMSLGEPWMYQYSSPYNAMTSGLTAMGVAVITANGNDGTTGLQSTSTPGLSPDVV